MDKDKFAKVLLSRFMTLPFCSKYEVISLLCTADNELRGIEDHSNTEFEEWATTLKEMLFPETIGDVVIGEFPPYHENDDENEEFSV